MKTRLPAKPPLVRGPQITPEMRARLTGPGGPFGPSMAAPKQQRPLGGGLSIPNTPNRGDNVLKPLPEIPGSSERNALQAFEAQRKAQMPGMGTAMKPPSSGIVSSSKEAIDKMPEMSFVPTIPRGTFPSAPLTKAQMMKSGGEVKREVESLASRYPKKGIDPTIPAGVREKLVEQEREKMFKAGEKAHSERTLAKGGSAKAYAKGGVTRADGCAQRGKTKGRMV